MLCLLNLTLFELNVKCRAIYKIHDDEDKPHSSINREERKKTDKVYTSAPLLVNRKYASMMQEVADFIDVWGL